MPRYMGARPAYSGRVEHSLAVQERSSDTPVQVQEAFASAMENLFPSLPGTISELRDALGGTGKASQAVGVTPRTIQRYIVAEQGGHGAHGGAQARGLNVAKRGELVRSLQNAVAPKLRGAREAAMERDGVALTALGSLRIAPGYTEGRFIHWRLEGQYWGGKAGILAAWRAGKKQLAARRFNRAFGASYGLKAARWSYLNELTLEPPN